MIKATSIIRRRTAQANSVALHSHPKIAQILSARGVSTAEEVDNSLAHLLKPAALGGVEQAVHLLHEALHKQSCIVVVGDYDVDGATSTALAVRVLRDMGGQNIHYFAPDRFRYGYGLSAAVIDALTPLSAQLLVTVDNGIASVEGVAAARGRNIDVLITDHHLPPKEVPEANAIVNPNMPGDGFASKNLAGVGVIFYVLLALRSHLVKCGWFTQRNIEAPNMAHYLDLVALGTIADLVPLDRNNRILVEQGLRRIRAGKTCAGIHSLFEISGRQRYMAVSTDLAFALGPRLNAAGRLDNISLGIDCLITDDADSARQMAHQLDQINRERRVIEANMQAEALDFLERWLAENAQQQLPHGLCLFDPNWHEGVIGILAGRIRESTHRPTVIFTRDQQSHLKGSARSVAGIHIRDAIALVDARHPGLIDRFGGHAMAAGLSLPEAHLSVFAEAFNQSVQQQTGGVLTTPTIETDGALSQQDLSLEFAEQIRYAAPWGQHFPAPLFDGRFHLRTHNIVGEKHLKMRLSPVDAEHLTLDAIAFNEMGEHLYGDNVDIVYKLDVNEFRGKQRLQLLIEYIDVAARRQPSIGNPAHRLI